MLLNLKTAPASEPLLLATVKAHLNVTSTSWDTQITNLIKVARRAVERYLKRSLITQTWEVYYDNLIDEMRLPYGPIQSVTSVSYYNLDGVLTVLPSTAYWPDLDGIIKRGYDVTYPEVQYGRPNAVVIEYKAGYGDDSTDVPEDIIHAMLIMITDLFENRGEVVIGASTNRIDGHMRNLLHDYRIYRFAN